MVNIALAAYARNIVKKIFLEDWPIKLAALGIALGLWLAVTGLSSPTTTRIAGVKLTMQTPNNTAITNSPPGSVDIVVTGDARRINRINNELGAWLDISDMQPGERTVALSPANVYVNLPNGVKLEDVQPNRIQIKLENIEERNVPIKAETTGDPANGFEVYSRVVQPATVTVRGAASLTENIDRVLTEKIDISGKNADFTAQQVPLAPTNTKAAIQRDTVSVIFRIGEKRIAKDVTITDDETKKRVTVSLYAPASVLKELKPAEIKCDIAKDANGKDTAQITLPAAFLNTIEIRSTKVL